ncbi:MAG: hypothetical protein HRT36_08460 [Alphaproteobacteria bacterium]|nr:hypothetical protein [Alphaproteobacteria bacterium]
MARTKLDEIITNLHLMQPDALWDQDDIAAYLRLSKASVQTRITNQAGFPRPIIIPMSGGKRWQAELVKTWAIHNGSKRRR